MANVAAVNICFFGLNRSLSYTISSIKEYIFQPLNQLGIVYSVYGAFVHVESFTNPRSNEFSVSPQNSETDIIDFDAYRTFDQVTLDKSIDWRQVFRYGDRYGEIDLSDESLLSPTSTTKNIFRSLFVLKESFALIPEGKLANPTIFIRPDLEILSSLDFQLYFDLLQYKPISTSQGEADGVALLPSWHSWGGLNDRFAICSSGNSSVAYATRFDSLLPYLQISRHPIHPETFLFHVMHASLVACYPVIYPYMSRIRASGRSQPEDFSKGQSSFDLRVKLYILFIQS